MVINLQGVAQMLQYVQSTGVVPAQLHMNKTTLKSFKDTMRLAEISAPRKGQSWKFNGIPLIANKLVPDGGIIVRPLHLMTKDNWMEDLRRDPRTQVAVSPTPQQTTPQGLPTPNEGTQELVKQKPTSVTDLLIAAATNCDDAKTVVIIMLRDNNEVQVTANTDHFTVAGLLNSALIRVQVEGNS